MDVQIKKKRAHELIVFLKVICVPSEISDPKNYIKIQKVRQALEKANSEYELESSKFEKTVNEEAKPFIESLQSLKLGPDAFKLEKEKMEATVRELTKEAKDNFDKYIKEHEEELIQVTLNSEDLNQVKLYFSSPHKSKTLCSDCGKESVDSKESPKGATYWIGVDAYIEIANFLGI